MNLELFQIHSFIFSHPTETWEEAQETIQIMEEFRDKSGAEYCDYARLSRNSA